MVAIKNLGFRCRWCIKMISCERDVTEKNRNLVSPGVVRPGFLTERMSALKIQCRVSVERDDCAG